ncbi:MAG TPA: AMP-binding protein [Verrucomicrobiales bacterium]|nr:AMP-binding protein [Verrucomicrobiales bacterium]
MNLVTLLRERADSHPARPALIDRAKGRDRAVTFRELFQRVERGSARLHELGLKRGNTVLVFQPVSIELYEILLSAFHSGIRVMLADPAEGKEFLTQCCARLPPDAFFGPRRAHLLRWFSSALRNIPVSIRSGGWFPGAAAWHVEINGRPPAAVPSHEPALITFTSGSTGAPKAAVRTHGFLLAQHKTLSAALDLEDGEVDLVTLPVFVLANLASGLTSVLAQSCLKSPGHADPAAICVHCARHGVTRCAASPAFFEVLLEMGDALHFLRKVYTGGAPVFPDLLERLQTASPDCSVCAVFGSTEAEPMTHLHAAEYDAAMMAKTAAGHGLCAGRPVPEIDLRILRDHWGEPLNALDSATFKAMLAPRNQPGEVVVSGDHVLSGYLDGIGDDETKINVEGTVWHRTGDAGWLDQAGRLWLLGRCSAKLPSTPVSPPGLPTGALDYPFAIESALRIRQPSVRTAALGWKGRRTLVVESSHQSSRSMPSREERAELCIEEVIRVKALPMDRRHHAKIDYTALHALLESMTNRTRL